MIETIKEKVITQTVYVATDGTEFTDLHEAETWESKLSFDKNWKDNKVTDDEHDVDYYTVNSLSDLQLLEKYMNDFNAYCFDLKFNPNHISYPIMIKYDNMGDVSLVDQETYDKHKKLCEMYESIM